MTLQQVSDILGSAYLELSFSSDIDSAAVQPAWSDRFVLTAEDYLHGVISVALTYKRRNVHCRPTASISDVHVSFESKIESHKVD